MNKYLIMMSVIYFQRFRKKNYSKKGEKTNVEDVDNLRIHV